MRSGRNDANDPCEQFQAHIRSGGRRLSQLLIDMAAQDMVICRIRVLEDRRDIRLIDRDGLQAPGPAWTALEVRGAIRFLLKEIFRRDGWKPECALAEGTATVRAHSGLLPPGMHALRCDYGSLPNSGPYLDLHVLAEDEVPVGAQSGEDG